MIQCDAILNIILQNKQIYSFMISDDQQRIIIAMALSVPLSFLIRKIQGFTSKELYSLITGTLLQYYVYGSDLIYVFGLHCLMYGICMFLPRRCGAIVTILSLCILSVYHIYRMITDYGSWVMDISTVLMTITCKYSLFAYAIEDGVRNIEKLTPEQKDHRLEKIPRFLSFLSYCQFVPTAVIGTALEYKKYFKFMNKMDEFKDIPSPWKQVGKDMGYSLILVAIYFLLGEMVFPLSAMKDQSFPYQSPAYIAMFSFFSVTFLRFKYYFAWKFSMGAVHAAGISYRKYQNKDKEVEDFKGIQTCNPQIVETTRHIRQKIANWNMSAQIWLRRCIYERFPIKNKSMGQLFTFMVSSFWHGFYGGYYLSFFLWFCQSHLQHTIFRLSKNPQNQYVKIVKKTGFLGDLFLWLGANLVFTINGVYFQVLSFRHGMKIMSGMHYIPPILTLGLIYLFTFHPGSPKKKAEKQ